MNERASTPIPVTLITGYLGAGKTSWLNARIRQGIPYGALILVNDFGTINLDADLIEYRSDRMLRLSNGCICCSLGESLAMELTRIARWPERPSALYIETSGVAEPARIIDLITVARHFELQATICLIDAASINRTLADPRVGELAAGQIRAADELSINRHARLDDGERRVVFNQLRRLNPSMSARLTHQLASTATTDDNAPPGSESASVTHAWLTPAANSRWDRFSIRLPDGIERHRLEAVLNEYADVLARAKGILCDVSGRRQLFQWSGGQANWHPTAAAGQCGTLIGIGFEGERFRTLAASLEALSR
ncbi:hypothetical protein FY550_02385 [Kushneria phosphatilytica]|uniref:CobW/HypB/UreG nucleotide-binding domain-containing protein n=1 Tax=Kushneria phosphatilytica TaxID=657387 RepID=A0A5C0ZZ80_9GAMM|nr:CobW family GTP-binding protein [Kushneria phosphatilytica]QEL10089.1 hypothetical protein FY550_02385 [Kushneria phosphatilytica]